MALRLISPAVQKPIESKKSHQFSFLKISGDDEEKISEERTRSTCTTENRDGVRPARNGLNTVSITLKIILGYPIWRCDRFGEEFPAASISIKIYRMA
jgi:hypothetical protein